jgi:hypothetical protein
MRGAHESDDASHDRGRSARAVPRDVSAARHNPHELLAGPPNPLGTLLPTVSLLRNVGIPVVILTLFLGGVTVLGLMVVRQVRTSRKTR